MSLYVYCVGEGLGAEALEASGGVGGARVCLLESGRLAAVVSEFEGESVAVGAENVRAHNRVNARVLARATPLPFRFGTLAEESRLEDYLKTNEEAIVAALSRVRGCVEMCVKIKWDGDEKAKGKRQKAKVRSEEAGGEELLMKATVTETTRGAEVDAGRVGSGTAFLLAKRRGILGEESARGRAEELAAWLEARVSEVVRESSARVSPSEAIVVRASHLVERERVEEYRESVRAARAERRGLQFLTSGPWPPYSFSELRR